MSDGFGLPEHERRRNARELEQLMAELDEVDRRHGLGARPSTLDRSRGRARSRRPRGERSRTALIAFIVSVLMLGYVIAGSIDAGRAYDRAQSWLTGEPVAPQNGRGYAFAQTQPGSDAPVGWDPCTPIRVLVNPQGSPPGGVDMVRTALERTSAASGLQLQIVGSSRSRAFFEPRRDLPEPVLIGWAAPAEVPELAGRVAGLGGAVSQGVRGGTRHLVQGSVVLDAPLFRSLQRSGSGRGSAQAIVDHEVGHLVGLAHVDDSTQLMNAESGTTEYGAGDLAGLAALGEVPCR